MVCKMVFIVVHALFCPSFNRLNHLWGSIEMVSDRGHCKCQGSLVLIETQNEIEKAMGNEKGI